MTDLAQAPAPALGRPAPPWREPATIGVVAAGATALLAVGNPNTTHIPLCPLKALTGLDCPFCGSLRAVHSLTHLRLGEALDHNLIFTVAAPFLVAAWVVWLTRSIRGTGPDGRAKPELPRWAMAALVVVVAAFGVARNVPAFHWLGSTA